ncbi:acyl-CoA thioesterase [Kibdelosporangium philippinense]|uniref:Acyl-CoA thioesterase n=1 Tax=Kibdelosporangium philippinense TaxID=211113 RepID=A0ABS8ZA41_9PSEU|nr:thioesterase family protein [Kibdelosporangium philippinense]MCE7004282.1 acyl-CoA thioesterase [Kibdelosporangium philippinense]
MPEATIERWVEWHDTDAAGHQHHSAIIRWAEEAEGELFRQLGLNDLWGRTPRVRHEVNYLSRLWPGERIRARIAVDNVGRTSMRLTFEVHGERGLAAEGAVVIVHSDPAESAATPWPDEVLSRLSL